MGEMDEMRAANAPAIKAANSTKTLSGGAPARKTPDEARAEHAKKMAAQNTSMKAKAKASQKQKQAAYEARRNARRG